MSVAKILVPLTGGRCDRVALGTAFAAARPFNAHVNALFVHPDPREAIPHTEPPLSPEVIQELMDSEEQVAAAAFKSARAALADTAEEAHAIILSAPQISDAVTASYTELTGHFTTCLEETALLSDLIVFPPIAHGDNPELYDAFIRILTKSERPVLLSPKVAPPRLGREIAVGWDGGMSAAHALTAALPFLQRAEAVHILAVRRRDGCVAGDVAGVKAYLDLHAIACFASEFDAGTGAIGDVLLEKAANSGCDLLVIGGYGHSRLRETMFGGVTQRIMSHSEIPVLMMH